jgi:cytidine deaminase
MNRLDRELCESALRASANAYAPYSGFAVGAAVRTKAGAVYTGANLENASLGVTMCAEVSAITAANAAGDYDIETIAVAGYRFTPSVACASVCTPCGRCRQLIFEASQISKVDVRVLSCNGDLSRIEEAPISELLPQAFGPQSLGLTDVWPEMRKTLKSTAVALSLAPPSSDAEAAE